MPDKKAYGPYERKRPIISATVPRELRNRALKRASQLGIELSRFVERCLETELNKRGK